jgi:hypothetical protein
LRVYVSHNGYCFIAPLQARRYKRGRGIFDTVKSAATKGLALSNKYGVAKKLQSMSDPRAKVAGQLLAMAGGRRPRKHYGRRK